MLVLFIAVVPNFLNRHVVLADSSLTCQATALHFPQRTVSAQESNNTNNGNSRKCLEQIPAAVVEEEHTLHGHNGAVKYSVGNGSRAKGLASVAEVGTKSKPLQ